MEANGFAMWVWLTAALLVPVFSALVAVRREVSIFRYKLWRARDGVVDAMYRGELPDKEYVTTSLRNWESAIRHAPEIKLLKMNFLLSTMSSEHLIEQRRLLNKLHIQLSEEEQETMAQYERQANRALRVYLLRGSLLGLALSVVAWISALAKRLFKRGSQDPPRASTREDMLEFPPLDRSEDAFRWFPEDDTDRTPTAAFVS